MNYILEGCDCVGKTSVIDEFLNSQDVSYYKGYKVKHFQSPPKKLSKEQQIEFQKKSYVKGIYFLNTNDNVLYDRFMLGEGVYGPKYRNYYPEYIRNLERTISENTTLVLLTAPEEVVKQRFDGQFISEDDIKDVLDKFNEEFDKSLMKNKIKLDTSELKPIEVYNELMKHEKEKIPSRSK